jgi:hypothetical protein
MAAKEVGDGEKEAAPGKCPAMKAVLLPFHLPSRLGGGFCVLFFLTSRLPTSPGPTSTYVFLDAP